MLGKASLLFFVCITALLLTGCSQAKNADWELVTTTGIIFQKTEMGSPGVNIAGFIDGNNGIATNTSIGAGGLIDYTKDGGKTWRKSQIEGSAMLHFQSLEMLPDGIAFTNDGTYFLRSTDGGEKWTSVRDYYLFSSHGAQSDGHYLSFIDRSHGWNASINLLVMTRDGGINWIPIPLPPDVNNNITTIHRMSETTGYILLASRVILKTADGGKTWERTGLPIQERTMIASVPGQLATEAIRFSDETHGTVILYTEKPVVGFLILATGDGGKNWREEHLPQNQKVLLGSVFLSRDGKYLTINDVINNKILLFRHL
jgi:photosystem II stability/assembly factor-like uncharacterized protein